MRTMRKTEQTPWTMPKWMEPYRDQLADYGLGVEDLMNDHGSNVQNNAYRAMVIVGMKDQVMLLMRLASAGMLAGTSANPKDR